MLCKSCEKEIPENQTVCLNCGTSALAPETAVESPQKKRAKKRGRKKNRTEPEVSLTVLEKEKEQSTVSSETAVTTNKSSDSANTDSKLIPETDEEVSMPVLQYQSADTEPVNEENVFSPVEREHTVYIPLGTQYVKLDNELPKADNKHTLPESSGIIYEIAEELYKKEKTASEIEALCQPPFKKVFDRKQIEQLERQAEEKTRRMLLSTTDETEHGEKTAGFVKEYKPLSTAKAFFTQLLLLLPLVNIVTALVFSFGKKTDPNIRAYNRAFLIWTTIALLSALGFFAYDYFRLHGNMLTGS